MVFNTIQWYSLAFYGIQWYCSLLHGFGWYFIFITSNKLIYLDLPTFIIIYQELPTFVSISEVGSEVSIFCRTLSSSVLVLAFDCIPWYSVVFNGLGWPLRVFDGLSSSFASLFENLVVSGPCLMASGGFCRMSGGVNGYRLI